MLQYMLDGEPIQILPIFVPAVPVMAKPVKVSFRNVHTFSISLPHSAL